jgi:hypothetical protein
VTPCPRDPSSGGSGLSEPILAQSPKFNHLGRPEPSPCVEQTLQIKSTQSCHREGPPVLGDSHTCPRTHQVAVSVGPFWPNPPKFNHLSRPKPSPCIGVADQTTQSCLKDLQYWRLPAPGTHPVVAVSVSILAKIPKFNHLSRPESMRWSRRCRSNQQSCHKKDLQYWGTPTCPRDPSSGGSGLCIILAQIPIPIHFGVVRSHLHALEQTLQINQLKSCHKKDLQYHCPRDCQWWHWSRSEPILAKILTSSIIWVVRARNTPCVGT